MALNHDGLMEMARRARLSAHAPYSNYRVGAAVLDSRGSYYLGCNVENASYPEGLCAEATAIGAMVTDGGRLIRAIAVVGDPNGESPCTPCGGCRQRILEFANEDTEVIFEAKDGGIVVRKMNELLPAGFRLNA